MADSPPARVLLVADPDRVGELRAALASPLPQGAVLVDSSYGGDDTIELFEDRKHQVVVVAASLAAGDAKSLIDAVRGMVPRAHVTIVVVGDDSGAIRTAIDAMDLEPDRFITRPLAPKALRYAVGGLLEQVALTRGSSSAALGGVPDAEIDAAADPTRSAMRARWEKLADSMVEWNPGDDDGDDEVIDADNIEELDEADLEPDPSPEPVPPPIIIKPRRRTEPMDLIGPQRDSQPELFPPPGSRAAKEALASLDPLDDSAPALDELFAPRREPTLILNEHAPMPEAPPRPQMVVPTVPMVPLARSTAPGVVVPAMTPAGPRAPASPIEREPLGREPSGPSTRAPTSTSPYAPAVMRSIPPLPSPQDVRVATGAHADDALPPRVDTGADDDALPPRVRMATGADDALPPRVRMATGAEDPDAPLPSRVRTATGTAVGGEPAPPQSRVRTANGLPPPPAPFIPAITPPSDADSVIVAERKADDQWSEPIAIAELAESAERESHRDLRPVRPSTTDELAELAAFDDDHDPGDEVLDGEPILSRTISEGRLEVLGDLAPPSDLRRANRPPPAAPTTASANLGRSPLLPGGEDAGAVVSVAAADGRDFARQLRAKMSMMAQRLFAGGDAPGGASAGPAVDHRPRHDHHTEIDLAALGEEPAELGGGGGTEIETRSSRGHALAEARDLVTSPGSWDSQVRERGLPDGGELVRGTSDAPMLLAKIFASQATCHVAFKRADVEKVVYFDQGRPVFAASNEPLDRMGELLVREGKITASQYERCQAVVAESGRRMGEILVDFGYLKRRELLPAVRRHVEDILYSLFGWDGGQYQIAADPEPSSERIRLSRHPAALVLEGIRRKLDRSTLERLVGPPSTVIEVPDRERLGGIVNLSDLSGEERAALAAIDGQVDLSTVARAAGVDVADLLPLAWGLCVLGLASARRTDTEIPDESTALVGETDLAIDRERVRARWQLVTDADYFALLGVRRDATAFEIRRAYQSARRDFASDCFPTDLRRELAQELADIASVLDEAFRVLRDDRLRLTYLSNLFA